ncbi:hypothetical protein B0H13DRAFT_2440637 [Mycena leptocephala]|nr:hypothetical protein B0H13DRAFT_2440637 [Mycena leptocephala]
METRYAQLHGACATPSRFIKPLGIVSDTPPPPPPHPDIVFVVCSGDFCPLPLVDAWATLQPARSPIAAEMNARTSRAQLRRHLLLPKSAQKQVSLAHAKYLQVRSVTVSRTMNGRTPTTPPDLPASLRGTHATFPAPPCYTLLKRSEWEHAGPRCFCAPCDVNATAQSLRDATTKTQYEQKRAVAARCKRPGAMQTQTCSPCTTLRPPPRDVNANAQPPRYARDPSSKAVPSAPADENAPAQCERHYPAPPPMRTPLRSPLRLVLDTPPVPHHALPAPARYVFVPLPVPPQSCRLRRPLSNVLPTPAQSVPTAQMRPGVNAPTRCKRTRTRRPAAGFAPASCAGSPCPAATFAAAPARCKHLRARPHARHANARPPNDANECEGAPLRR